VKKWLLRDPVHSVKKIYSLAPDIWLLRIMGMYCSSALESAERIF
jgi:hypothetical protein